MPDYNLGRAHGTIRVDYDGRGVEQADDDLHKLGDTAEETGRRVTDSTSKSSTDYDQLAAAARRLEQEVARAAAAEISARARATAAQEHLVQVQNSSASSAKNLLDAQRQLTAETKRYEDAVMKAQTANRALSNVRRQLATQAKPDLSPDVDSSQFENIIRHLKNIDKSTKTSSGFLNTFRSRIALMIAAIALASPTVAGLGVALVSLAGLAGVAAGAIAALAAVGATLATAFSGLGDAFKAAGKAAGGGGASAAQAASQQRAAARQIEQAIRGVRDAEENLVSTRREAARAAVQASQQIIQAERQLRDAQFDAVRAQANLTRARRDAARQLEDLRSQLTGGALDERQAVLDVKRAEEELNKTRADPRSSANDIEQSVINLERQRTALENVGRQNQRLQQDQSETAAKGVDGAEQVVDAQHDVVTSQEAVGDAAIGVAEAVVGAAQQQIDSQVDIRNATEQVADAQRDLAEAYLSAAEAGAAGGAAAADAMAKISPEARKLVSAILDQSGAWQEVKFAVQDALFAGLSDEVAPLANKWLPLLKTGMVGIATELHGLIVDLIDFLHQGQTTADVATIFENTRQAVHNIVPAVRALLSVFLDLATVGSGFLPDMAEGFAQWAQHLAEVSARSRETGGMQQWMQTALTTLGKLWELLGNVASIIGTIFGAFSAEGGDALTTLVNLTQRLEDFLKSAEGQDILHALGKTLAAIAHLIGDVLIGALAAFGPVFVTLAPLIQQFADVLGGQILVVFGALAPILQIVAVALSFLGPVLVPLVASFVLLNKAIQVAAVVWRVLNGVMRANPFLAIIAIVIALATLIVMHWDQIKTAIFAVWDAIKTAAEVVWNVIRDFIVNPIKEAVQWVIDFFTNLWNGVKERWDALVDLTKRAIEIMKEKLRSIGEAIQDVLDFFQNLQAWIGDKLRDAGHWLVDVGKNIIDGLLRGLKNAIGAIWDFISDIGQGIADAFSSVLDIFSPSKVFEKFGEFTLEGYLVGMDNLEPTVISRVVEVAANIANAGQPDVLVPTTAIPAQRVSPDAGDAGELGPRSIVVQNLNLTVSGNLDPTNAVTWRRAIKKIKKDIEEVDRSEQP